MSDAESARLLGAVAWMQGYQARAMLQPATANPYTRWVQVAPEPANAHPETEPK